MRAFSTTAHSGVARRSPAAAAWLTALLAMAAGWPAPGAAAHPLRGDLRADLRGDAQRQAALLPGTAAAIRSGGGSRAAKSASPSGEKPGSEAIKAGAWIVTLEAPTLVERLKASPASFGLDAASDRGTGAARRQALNSSGAQALVAQLDSEFDAFASRAEAELGRPLTIESRYRAAVNGFSTRLSETEARRLLALPGVRNVEPVRSLRLHTDAGPEHLGADDVWAGVPDAGDSRGEGVIVGIIDSGINWDHPSFADPGQTGAGHNHVNPLGSQVGLCSDPEVLCNDKLIGVYDLVEDDPQTEVEENFNKGRDDGDHGSHVAGTAAGNTLAISLNGIFTTVSGVAPNANIISYRVCSGGDPDDDEDDRCWNDDIIEGVEQAILDGVDVLNISLGGGRSDPWGSAFALSFLSALEAGILTVTSAGNCGPTGSSDLCPAIGESSNTSPGLSPWLLAVGSATHSSPFATRLDAIEGGASPLPGALVGGDFTQANLADAPIVYAGDFGHPLCGQGDFTFSTNCDDTSSDSNPFPPGTFNGEIVVCDRGVYGRIEKGINLLLAGAGGYVLANTDAQGESINQDRHCLPATHLGDEFGDELRAWLETEPASHRASLTKLGRFQDDRFGDRLSGFSSRGPNLPPVGDILKPNLIAPGDFIWAADQEGAAFVPKGGTSMASPHVAGAAALLKSLHPDWTPDMIASALMTTATDESAKGENGQPVTHHATGHGRPRLALAADAGLYFPVSVDDYLDADPDRGGSPVDLNLPNLTEDICAGVCTFRRTVRDLAGGGSWSAVARDFPPGVEVTVTPSAFSLGAGGQQALTIEVDVSRADAFGSWVYGKVVLESSGAPDAVMPVSVFVGLPDFLNLASDQDGGSTTVQFGGLAALPQATFITGGLTPPDLLEAEIEEDETYFDPYDSDQGTVTVLVDVPEDALWLLTRLLSPAWLEGQEYPDLDLFVGYDANSDGRADAAEEVCFSIAFPQTLELCDVFEPIAGTWWVVAQNWESDGDVDNPGGPVPAQLITAVVGGGDRQTFGAAGPGIVPAGEPLDLELFWTDVDALPGELLVGALNIGSARDTVGDVGLIPVFFERTGLSAPTTLTLFDGAERRFTLDAESRHDRIFIDVPAGADSLEVGVTARDAGQGGNLRLRLVRQDFDQAFAAAPEAGPAPNTAPAADVSGAGDDGPVATVSGAALQPGRWFAVVDNGNDAPASLRITATVGYADGAPNLMRQGMWDPRSRPDISQGLSYAQTAGFRSVLWYTFGEDAQPVWYLAAAPEPAGNQWRAPLERFTNDGATQASSVVGDVSITMLSENDAVFSWTLKGVSGSDRIGPTIPDQSCEDFGAGPVSVTGVWGIDALGLGGGNVATTPFGADFVIGTVQYLYDGQGYPRWLQGAGVPDADGTIPLEQFEGFCPHCNGPQPTFETVGLLTLDPADPGSGDWILEYSLAPPLIGDVDRQDPISKLSDGLACP